MTFLVGIDGGGTRTRAVIIDLEGRELGRSRVSGAVATADRPEDVVAAVTAAARAAASEAAVELPASVMWAGLAGAGNDRARAAVERSLPDGLAHRTLVGTDVEAAFHDAFGAGPGVLLIAGTGSVAWARGGDGSMARVGGWGQHLGDEGSGYALGSLALRSVTHGEDGRGPDTALRDVLLTALPVRAVGDLIPWVATATKSEVAALAPHVVAAADDGDEVAEGVVEVALAGLVAHVTAAFDSVGDTEGPTPELVLWGGLIAEGGSLRGRLLPRLAEAGHSVSARTLDPAMGAARLALAAVRSTH